MVAGKNTDVVTGMGRHDARNPGSVPEPSTWVLAAVVLTMTAGMAYLFCEAALWLMASMSVRQAWWSYPLSAFVAGFLAIFGFYLREVRRNWWEYPVAEIGLGIALAVLAVKSDNKPIVNIIVFLAAVRVILDGIKRMRDFQGLDHPPRTPRAVGW